MQLHATVFPVTDVIVFEQHGLWAAALRRTLDDPSWPLHETRTLDQCWTELRTAGRTLLLLAIEGRQPSEALARLARLPQELPQVQAIVVADRSRGWLAEQVWAWGAIYFTTSPRQLVPVCDIMRRFAAATAPEPRSVREEVWARLPWERRG